MLNGVADRTSIGLSETGHTALAQNDLGLSRSRANKTDASNRAMPAMLVNGDFRPHMPDEKTSQLSIPASHRP